jgi:hypothetical protein
MAEISHQRGEAFGGGEEGRVGGVREYFKPCLR